MLTISDNARSAVEALTKEASPDAGVRIAVAEPVQDSQAPQFSLAIAEAPEPNDEVVEDQGARVFVGSQAAKILADRTLDAQMQTPEQVAFFIR